MGATDVKNIAADHLFNAVLEAYNEAVTCTFIVGLVLACLTIFNAVAMELKVVKSKMEKRFTKR